MNVLHERLAFLQANGMCLQFKEVKPEAQHADGGEAPQPAHPSALHVVRADGGGIRSESALRHRKYTSHSAANGPTRNTLATVLRGAGHSCKRGANLYTVATESGRGVWRGLVPSTDEPSPGETPAWNRGRTKMPKVAKKNWMKFDCADPNPFKDLAEDDETQPAEELNYEDPKDVMEQNVGEVPPPPEPHPHRRCQKGCCDRTGKTPLGKLKDKSSRPMVSESTSRVHANRFKHLEFLKMLGEAKTRGAQLMAAKQSEFQGKWERLRTTMDSGATVTVIPPSAGRWYDIEESAASRAGIEYEIANGDTLPNLGQKVMPVVVGDGCLRSMTAQVADITTALTAPRALHKSGHMTIFDGPDSFVLNKLTGEVTPIDDDGTSYNFDLWICPPEEVEAMQQRDFTWQHP